MRRANDVTRCRRSSGIRRILQLHMQQRVAGGRHGRRLESATSYQSSKSEYLYMYTKNNPESCKISFRSDLKRRSLGAFFEERRSQKETV